MPVGNALLRGAPELAAAHASKNALLPYGPSPVAPAQPKRNGMQNVLSSFARGFIGPDGVAAIEDRRHELKTREQDDQKALAGRALTWMQNTARLPASERAKFTRDNAQQIAADTGQPLDAIIASVNDPNAFSDASMQQGIAQFSSLAGEQMPKPDYQGVNLGDGGYGVFNPETGKFETLRNPQAKPVKRETAKDVNDIERYIDTQEPVFPNIQKDPEDPETMTPYQQAQIDLARKRLEQGGAGGQLTPYQAAQLERQEAADAAKKKEADNAKRVRVNNLNEGIALVDELVAHPGFGALYGMQGVLPRVPGSDGANAEALLEQIGGQAFLAGVDSMRGTGPLSDREGQAVKAARTRLLNRGQSKESAAAAARDFTNSMKRLLQVHEQESGGGAPADGMDDAGADSDAARWAEDMVAKMFPGVDVAVVRSDEDYDALPSGTEFLDPQGQKRRKP
jgi:hypothetical protein